MSSATLLPSSLTFLTDLPATKSFFVFGSISSRSVSCTCCSEIATATPCSRLQEDSAVRCTHRAYRRPGPDARLPGLLQSFPLSSAPDAAQNPGHLGAALCQWQHTPRASGGIPPDRYLGALSEDAGG